jgi:hypothetical protein
MFMVLAYPGNAVKRLSESLSGYVFDNEKLNITIKVLDRLMPALLSSIFTIFSAVSSSFVYGFSEFLYNSSIFVILLFNLGIIFYPLLKAGSKKIRIKGVKVERKIKVNEDDRSKPIVRDNFKPIYEKNPIGAVKSTFVELSEVAFIILFPGGLSDVLIGISENSPTIGLNGTGQLELGIILVTVSLLFLFITIARNVHDAKHKLAKKMIEMKDLIYDINEMLGKSPNLIVLLDNTEETEI